MPILWWKTPPTPAPEAIPEPQPRPVRVGAARPWSEGTPQRAQPAPTGFDSTKLRGSAEGWAFESDASRSPFLKTR